jgi:hypothetical protein
MTGQWWFLNVYEIPVDLGLYPVLVPYGDLLMARTKDALANERHWQSAVVRWRLYSKEGEPDVIDSGEGRLQWLI